HTTPRHRHLHRSAPPRIHSSSSSPSATTPDDFRLVAATNLDHHHHLAAITIYIITPSQPPPYAATPPVAITTTFIQNKGCLVSVVNHIAKGDRLRLGVAAVGCLVSLDMRWVMVAHERKMVRLVLGLAPGVCSFGCPSPRRIRRIRNCEYGFPCEDLALTRRISFLGYDVLVRNE
nr:hypothetical protein [Tanacetum cinerariifolium]